VVFKNAQRHIIAKLCPGRSRFTVATKFVLVIFFGSG
jgi:hypothetical protein